MRSCVFAKKITKDHKTVKSGEEDAQYVCEVVVVGGGVGGLFVNRLMTGIKDVVVLEDRSVCWRPG
jgi:tRNA A37 threonylcarbamoyladenosine dehydratase